MPETATKPDAPGTYELTIERLLPAPPDRVFDAWVNPETLVKWWGPEGFTTPEHTLDVRPDGRWRTVMRAPDGVDHIVSGVYRTIDRPERLVFSWAWEDKAGKRGHESEVEITFTLAGAGTHLVLVHRQIADQDSCDRHRAGWISSINDLERQFA